MVCAILLGCEGYSTLLRALNVSHNALGKVVYDEYSLTMQYIPAPEVGPKWEEKLVISLPVLQTQPVVSQG